MKREIISLALNHLDDRHISDTAAFSPESVQDSPERILYMKKKRVITFALAAALLLSLAVAAYAAFFSMSREVPDPSETFRIHWEDSPSGYIEWKNAKLAVTFPETAESREIEFHPGWLPFALPDTLAGCLPWSDLTEETWFSRFSAESLCFAGSGDSVPEYRDMSQPLLIESYAMSQFNRGGAMLLLYFTPGEITEEHWEEQDVDVMRFHATQHFDPVPEFNLPERTLEHNIILLSNAEAGWVVRICGEIDMDQLLEVARNLEIRETGRVLTYEDFEDHYTFFDGGVG